MCGHRGSHGSELSVLPATPTTGVDNHILKESGPATSSVSPNLSGSNGAQIVRRAIGQSLQNAEVNAFYKGSHRIPAVEARSHEA